MEFKKKKSNSEINEISSESQDIESASARQLDLVENHEKVSNSLSVSDLEGKNGIFIYENAREKLNISRDGKIYRQKWFNYLPFISIFIVLGYVNFIYGKTKCLKDNDLLLFKRAAFWSNIVGFIAMPIAALCLWTFGTWLIYDIIPASGFGKYSDLWNQNLVNPLALVQSPWMSISNFFSGLFTIAIAPFTTDVSVYVQGVSIPVNLFFIITFLLFTILNPLNIIFTFIMNSKILRFITIYESSSIYRYRK